MKKDIVFNTEAREALNKGITKMADAVRVTFGAAGRNVVYTDMYGRHKVTKDGVTVAKHVQLSDPVENMGAELVREVSMRTGDTVGDGTTTSMILAEALISAGHEAIMNGANPIDVKRGIDKAVTAVTKYLAKVAIPVKDEKTIKHIASISANNDEELGSLIAEAFSKTGKHGVIRVEPSKDWNTRIETVEGMKLDRGIASPYFMPSPDAEELEFENPLIMLYDGKVETMNELLPIIKEAVENTRPLVIIANDFEGQVLSVLAHNNREKKFKVAAVKAPDFGDARREMLHDVAVFVSAIVGADSIGLTPDKMTSAHIGTAVKVIISKESTIIMEGFEDHDRIVERLEVLRTKTSETETPQLKEALFKRIANLNGGIAVLQVGATSEVELGEKIDRADDAVGATRAAIEEGIVPGGGVTLLRAADILDNVKTVNDGEKLGVDIVERALRAPLKSIVKNAGAEYLQVLSVLRASNKNTGFDVKTGKYVNMVKAGIIDPKKVTRVALESAASVAGMVLITECVLNNNQ